LQAWVGPGYERAVLFLQALAIGHFVHTLTSAGTTIVRAIGKPEYETRYTVILLIGDALVGLLLIGVFGYSGAVVATPAVLVVSSLYFYAIFHRLFGASMRHLLRVYMAPCVVSAGLAVGVWLLLMPVGMREPALGRWPQLVFLLLLCIGYTATYAFILWRRQYLDELDYMLILRYLPRRMGRSHE
jgi:O-antigen/teichoic acid export membrane protein